MTLKIEFECEDDGRWLAEVIELPGVLAYGLTADEAIAKVRNLAVRAQREETTPSVVSTIAVNHSYA
jgi:hypothetical protein